MEDAHTDMVRDPSAFNAEGEIPACQGCHQSDVDANRFSLHTKLWGEKKLIETRGDCVFEGSGFEDKFAGKCGGCHTTCGQCHVSRPNSVGGGFPKIGSYYSHRFRASPDMNEQCTACHGSRIGIDYKGELEGNVPDLHRSAGQKCEDCHSREEIHGDPSHTADNHYEHRYEVTNMPRCENCHGAGIDTNWDNDFHTAHVDGFGSNLQCNVCHSQPYKNCTNCHNLDPDGNSKFDIDPSVIQFKIANNPSPYRTEYDIVVVRHIPVDPGTYSDWGLDLPDYLEEPTWKYASPHNVLLNTPQTHVESGHTCSFSCHQSTEFLLRETDLYDDMMNRLPDYDANVGIVIEGSLPR
ncbi:hypothetical protein HN843_08530 [bacterium]|jgi:thiosulfate/3-mercaptopyruvate sulfurtransferase|nr:hypothetical protein [bacterium]